MSTTDGAIDQKLYCLLLKTVMQIKHQPTTKYDLSLSAQIKHHNRHSSIITNLKYE